MDGNFSDLTHTLVSRRQKNNNNNKNEIRSVKMGDTTKSNISHH